MLSKLLIKSLQFTFFPGLSQMLMHTSWPGTPGTGPAPLLPPDNLKDKTVGKCYKLLLFLTLWKDATAVTLNHFEKRKVQ